MSSNSDRRQHTNNLTSRLAIWQHVHFHHYKRHQTVIHDTNLDGLRAIQPRASHHANGQWPPARGIQSNKTKIKILIPSEQSVTERMKATKVNEIQDANQ
jgi:hypothetical protein